jgi:phosphatidylinositol glycan class Q protein
MKRKCRIWLPKQLASTDDLSHSLLFGWFVCHSSSCLDVVVSFISDESSLSNAGSKLQVITPPQQNKKSFFSSFLINSVCDVSLL